MSDWKDIGGNRMCWVRKLYRKTRDEESEIIDNDDDDDDDENANIDVE